MQANTESSQAFVKPAVWIACPWAGPWIADGIASGRSSGSQIRGLKLHPSALPFPGTAFVRLPIVFTLSIQTIRSVFTDPMWSSTWEISSGIIHVYSVFLSRVICSTSQFPKASYQTSVLGIKSSKYYLILSRRLAKYFFLQSCWPLTSEQCIKVLINWIDSWNNQFHHIAAADLNRTKTIIFQIGSWNIFTTAWDFIFLAPPREMKRDT